ncbi:MAG: glycosyltransferase [Caldilineae bacterium]|nr:MAG: glycosyltransferase [Caldilineae bacterium]
MRIGMFCNAYRPVINGVVRSIALFRQGLQQAGHFVSIFAPDSKGYRDEEPFVFRYPALPLPTGVEYTFPVVVAPQITWLVPKLKLDIIHTHHPFIVGSEALNFSRTEGIPIVFTFHTIYHEYTQYFGFDVELFKTITRRIVADYAQKVHCIIAPSLRIRDELYHTYKVDRPVHVLRYPVDLSPFSGPRRPPLSDPERVQLLYLGRLVPEKNLHFLLRAFALAAAEEPRLHLRIVGEGSEREALQAEIGRMDLSARVELAGPVPFCDAPGELLRADVFLYPAQTESMSMAVLEAMAAGLPVVAVDCAALREYLDHRVEGVLVPEEEEAFAAALLELARMPELARRLGEAGRTRARSYSLSSLTPRLIAIYQETIEQYYRTRAA